MPVLARRTVLTGALALLAGCGPALPPDPPPGEALPLTLVSAFAGRTRGRGVFVNRLTGAERRFTARLNGRLEGDRLTVAEDFLYDDGQTDRLTWVFTRIGEGRWTGRREDTVGLAEAVEDGRTIRLSYLADFRSPGRVTRLGFADVIWRRPDGVVINEGVVTRFGLPVGEVRFEIRR
jgi:hypothetical protein